jgi:anthranilate synthase component 1
MSETKKAVQRGSGGEPALALPTWEAFRAAATGANLLSLCVPIAFDHETAVALADRFVNEAHVILLESATMGPGSMARYSFLGFDPAWTWEWRLETQDAKAPSAPFAEIRRRTKAYRQKSVYPEGVRLGGPDVAAYVGVTGFFGFDAAAALEPSIGKPPPKQLGLPDAFFFLPRNFLVLDHLARRLFVCRNVLLENAAGDATSLRRAYDEGLAALRGLLKRVSEPHVLPPLRTVDRAPDFESCAATMTRSRFEAAAQRSLEEIRAGEIFQIQIGNRLSRPTAARPFDIFRHLRTLNPSPYMFFYKFGEEHLIGASPEMMVGVAGRTVTHRPIAGTRKRTWESGKDARMRRELMESEKERAEHVMLVDLARNDVGRVAAPGSVRVDELMAVEEYSHVFHMVSQVSGELASGQDAVDALVSGFPNGTVSGAPKIRAMQLIYELEAASREFYAGSLGLFDFHGDLRSTILIRTIHVARGVASTHASAGIVYDSVPDDEWLETRNKMAAALIALQNTL